MRIEGVATNLPLHRRILEAPEFTAGGVDIHYLEALLRAEAGA
jgi:acetyl-CoA carboxylase biotin carboxylase subunit